MAEKNTPYFIAIGASGSEGLHDIGELLSALGNPSSAVVMVVLHRPSNQPSSLRAVLARRCTMPVIIATDATELQTGCCYIGEPDAHLTLLARQQAHLVPGVDDSMRNRTVDALFESVAANAGPRMIDIILSGALADGSRGLAAIHAANGITMVLDPKHKPRGMQKNAIDFDGPISVIGSGPELAKVISRILAESQAANPSAPTALQEPAGDL